MTGIEMCEVISDYWFEIDRTVLKLDPNRIWECSPRGELFMVFMWYKEAEHYYRAKRETGYIDIHKLNSIQKEQIKNLMMRYLEEEMHHCHEHLEFVSEYDNGESTMTTYRCAKCGAECYQNVLHQHVKD